MIGLGSTEIYASVFAGAGHGVYEGLAMGGAVAKKIKNLRYQLGLNQSELAQRLGVTQASVSRWETGSVPDATRLTELAKLAGETVGEFISGSSAETASSTLNRFWVKGVVAAGVWTVAYEWAEEDWTPYSGLANLNAPPDARYGLRVDGESMNQIYPDGTILDCVSIHQMPELKSGQRVIVERIRHDGHVEATVKEYILGDDGREWLMPRSNRPEFQMPIPANDPGGDVSEIRVVAVVVGSYRPEPL